MVHELSTLHNIDTRYYLHLYKRSILAQCNASMFRTRRWISAQCNKEMQHGTSTTHRVRQLARCVLP
jgi:hypothetical protein